MKNQVDLLIITYNQEKYIGEAIESAVNQTYDNVKVVVADDCSTDNTRKVIDTYYFKYPDKVIRVYNESNLGITGNSNAGLLACNGEYFVIMGGDDVLYPTKIQQQLDVMLRNGNCALCYHDMLVYYGEDDPKNHLYSDVNKPRLGNSAVSMRYGTFNCASSTMVRSDCIPEYGFDRRLEIASDFLFWIDVLEKKKGESLYIPNVLGKYRKHDDNITSTSSFRSLEDHLLTAMVTLSKYPHLRKESLIYLSGILRRLRRKPSGYLSFLLASIKVHFSFKALIAILLYMV
ncbi:glycosyltransferase, partial [bacterium]|nr:glycosyltransferase [bacterium]